MTTLVTGAFGCIGAWVVRRLVARGERPVLYDAGEDPWRLRLVAGDAALDAVVMVRGDIADREHLAAVVRDHAIDRVIHLAAWQVPLCREDPAGGARVNVVGTAAVFEAVRASRGRIPRVVYVSSAGVFGPAALYPPGPLPDDAPPRPSTHYGVYKVANEETARVYWEEHRLPSSGFRPMSVYGPGRDFGLTADPTLAMKSVALGRPFRIRWGGATDLIYADDVARALIAGADAALDGARVYNLHGESATMPDLVALLERLRPGAAALVSVAPEPLPFPAALADARFQHDFGRQLGGLAGPLPPTGLEAGVRATLEAFERLQAAGRLDARELTPFSAGAPGAGP